MDRANKWMMLAANLSVFVGIAFLAIEIRQATNSVQGSMELESARLIAEWHGRVNSSPELRRIWNKAAAGEELSEDERSAYIWLVAEFFFLIEGFFNQYERGLISESSWESLKTVLIGFLKNDLVRLWWDRKSAPFSGEFFAYIEEVKNQSVEFSLQDIRTLDGRDE